jgi:receptor protein-tyrosine kinase
VQGAEAFRTLTAQMEAADRPPRVVLFTSASSGDGKTTSALRLAHALRETGRTVAFLNFDLRKPFDRSGRGRRGRRGPLQDLAFDEKRRLRWGAPLSEGLVRSANDQDLAFALPEAPKDSASRGAFSRQLDRFTSEARASFDAVVIDTSPLGEVADALPLMEHADAIIVVVRLGATTRVAFSRMLDLMDRSGVTPFGVLLVGGGSDLPSPYYRELAGVGASPGRG